VEIITNINKSLPCHQIPGGYSLTISPFFKDAGRGKERIWGEETATPQPMVINWTGLNDKEKAELIPTLSTTDNWILLTHPQGASNKSHPPFRESQRIARADGKCSRHQGWWREGKDELATHSMTTEDLEEIHRSGTEAGLLGIYNFPGAVYATD